MSLFTLCTFTVDPNLGRVDYSTFPDQTLMEMLIKGFGEAINREYQDDDGMYLDVCEWDSVRCDEEDRAFELNLYAGIEGTLQLSYIPPKMKTLCIEGTKLTGSIDFENLPQSMEALLLGKNHFTGSINIANMPESMQMLDVHSNEMTSSIDLAHLRDGLVVLSLYDNQLTGEIDLSRLPQRMQILHLHKNKFTGSLDLTQLPQTMKYLFLQENQFSGSFIATSLPTSMRSISAGGNNLTSIAVVDSKTRAEIDLTKSRVEKVVDENGMENFRSYTLRF